ncbi:MAG: hypothetical protein AB7F99_14685 [Vicinamibacterales bacterium]
MLETVVLNPNLELKPVRQDGQITAITVIAPVKGRNLHQTTVARSEEPQLFGALLLHGATGGAGGAGGFGAREQLRLADIGVLIPEDRVSTPVWFSCDIDAARGREALPHRGASENAQGARQDLVVNPTLRHFGCEGFPDDMRGRVRLANRFRTDRSWLWVERPHLAAPCVYSYSSSAARELDDLVPGAVPPPALDRCMVQRLLDAGVIVSSSAYASDVRARAHAMAAARAALGDRRYVVIPEAIAPLQLAAVRRYYQDLIGEGFLVAGDKDWPDRHFSGRDPIGYFFHHQLNALVSAIAGRPLKPSFSFFASYRPGSVLPPHRDRAQCEYALSIQLDFSPEPEDTSPWPLFVQPPGQPAATAVPTRLGGAVLYFGKEVRHHRDVLTGGDYSRHWFCFYVPDDFEGPLD